jgi:Protein of unknown function DUF262
MSKIKNSLSEIEITDEKRNQAEIDIRDKQKVVDYDTKEYPVEVLVQKYIDGLEDDENELYIPDYQRELVWSDEHQSKFIESIFLGLPIPYLFVADLRLEKEDLARLEIIDGTQRIRTLERFVNNKLKLCGLKKLSSLNDFQFSNFSLARQRRFYRATIRMIVLTEKADEEVRRDMFERINTGSIGLNDMEKRRGISPGPFVDLIEELAKEPIFLKLCPFSDAARRSREPEEFVLRFFAYLDNYQKFGRQVNKFLNDYLKIHNNHKIDKDRFRRTFHSMLAFVENNFPNGFSKSSGRVRTPRIRFEAISVGVALSLQKNSALKIKSIDWLNSKEFKEYTTSDASNSKSKVIQRIEYVRDQLLNQS